MGHVFIVHGDLRKLCCDAWLMPCGIESIPNKPWLEWPPNVTTTLQWSAPPPDWHGDRLRVKKLTGWPDEYPQPYLTNVGADTPRRLEWFIAGAVQFVEHVAVELQGRSARYGQRARPLLAVPMVGTGYGGAASFSGNVVRLLIPALTECAARHHVDIALVTYDEAAFAAAQAFRRATGNAWPELPGALRRCADRLAKLAERGELVLFLGAGVSAMAGLPMWGELLTNLARGIGLSDEEIAGLRKLDYMDQAHILEQRCGDESTPRRRIAEALSRHHHALGHALLASLPVREIVTTNYDQLFELAYTSAGRKTLSVLPHAPQPGTSGWILKMHGSVDRPQDIVLTRRDYMRYDEQRAALAGIVQAQLITKQMLFVGFSMADANFLRIADAVRRALRAAQPAGAPSRAFGVALPLSRNPLLEELWRHDLEWMPMDSGDEPGGAMSTPEAARRLDIFLDYLVAQSSSASAYLLDPRYDGVLSDDDRVLRNALETFLSEMPKEAQRASAWPQIEQLMLRLGGFPHALMRGGKPRRT